MLRFDTENGGICHTQDILEGIFVDKLYSDWLQVSAICDSPLLFELKIWQIQLPFWYEQIFTYIWFKMWWSETMISDLKAIYMLASKHSYSNKIDLYVMRQGERVRPYPFPLSCIFKISSPFFAIQGRQLALSIICSPPRNTVVSTHL